MCQELACWPLAGGGQRFLDIEPCNRNDDGDRGPSVSTRAGAFSLQEAAALNEIALVGKEPDSGVGISAQVQLSGGLSFNLHASACFSSYH